MADFINGQVKFFGGVSNLGNTVGTTGVVFRREVLVGGSNVTLSQSTNSQSATITINAANQTAQTQNLFDLTLSGNTSGALALISSGTLTLAGGNNITLSQNANAVTISAFNQSTAPGGIAASNTTFTSGTVVFVGSDMITVKSGAQSVVIDATQSVQTQNLIDVTLSGNTSGTSALVSSGTLTLAGGNNITLSQVGNAVTISGPTMPMGIAASNSTITSGTVVISGSTNLTASYNGQTILLSVSNQSVQTQSIVRDVNISGNTSGTTADISSGTLTLAGGNNITLSQVGNAITVSAFNQSVQTQNLVTVNGSTGNLSINAGNLISISNNNSTISVINVLSSGAAIQDISTATNAGTDSSKFALDDHIHRGVRNLQIAGNTSGTTGSNFGDVIFAGGNNITLSENGNSITISAFNQSVQTQNVVVPAASNSTITSGTAVFSGSTNLTVSYNGQIILLSVSNQSVQTQSIVRDVNIGGNTTGTTADISSGTLTLAGGSNITLSQAGNAVTISAFRGISLLGDAGITANTNELGFQNFSSSDGNITFEYFISNTSNASFQMTLYPILAGTAFASNTNSFTMHFEYISGSQLFFGNTNAPIIITANSSDVVFGTVYMMMTSNIIYLMNAGLANSINAGTLWPIPFTHHQYYNGSNISLVNGIALLSPASQIVPGSRVLIYRRG